MVSGSSILSSDVFIHILKWDLCCIAQIGFFKIYYIFLAQVERGDCLVLQKTGLKK